MAGPKQQKMPKPAETSLKQDPKKLTAEGWKRRQNPVKKAVAAKQK